MIITPNFVTELYNCWLYDLKVWEWVQTDMTGPTITVKYSFEISRRLYVSLRRLSHICIVEKPSFTVGLREKYHTLGEFGLTSRGLSSSNFVKNTFIFPLTTQPDEPLIIKSRGWAEPNSSLLELELTLFSIQGGGQKHLRSTFSSNYCRKAAINFYFNGL